MADIGAELRRARIARKQSIDDIARATKITPSLVRAIESDAFAKLPGGLFTRGFLRAFAREVGLNPEEIVGWYRAEFEPSTAQPPDSQAPAQPIFDRSPSPRAAATFDDSTQSREVQILQLCIILLIVALYFGVVRRPTAPTVGDVKTVAPAEAAAPGETPVATNGRAEAPAPVDTPLLLEFRAQSPCWIEATADGQPRLRRLMGAGERETVTARDAVSLRIGDPGALTLSINGVAGKPLGRPGRLATAQITRANYKTFLQTPE